MLKRTALQFQSGQGAGLMEDEGEHVVAVAAMMTVFIVRFAIGTAKCAEVMTGMPGTVMVVIVEMCAHRVHRHVPMQAGRRCPGKLERNDEHDDQGDETTHESDSTDSSVITNSSSYEFAGLAAVIHRHF